MAEKAIKDELAYALFFAGDDSPSPPAIWVDLDAARTWCLAQPNVADLSLFSFSRSKMAATKLSLDDFWRELVAPGTSSVVQVFDGATA